MKHSSRVLVVLDCRLRHRRAWPWPKAPPPGVLAWSLAMPTAMGAPAMEEEKEEEEEVGLVPGVPARNAIGSSSSTSQPERQASPQANAETVFTRSVTPCRGRQRRGARAEALAVFPSRAHAATYAMHVAFHAAVQQNTVAKSQLIRKKHI